MKLAIAFILVLVLSACDTSSPQTPVAPATQPVVVAPEPPLPPAEPRVLIRPDGTVELPAGTPAEINHKRSGTNSGRVLSHQETARAQGSNVNASGEKIDSALVQSAPRNSIGGVSMGEIESDASTVEGSTTSAKSKILGQTQNAATGYALGIILILAGAALTYFVGPKWGLPVVALGILSLYLATLIDKYPWVILVIGTLLLAGIGVALAAAWRKSKEAQDKALVANTLVDAVDTHTKATGDKSILDAISYEASGPLAEKFKKLVVGIKQELGITGEDPFIKAKSAEAPEAGK